MSYQEIYEIYVICDQNRCQATLDINCATEMDADEEAAKNGWQCVDGEGIHYCPYHWHLECRECCKCEVGPMHRLEYEGWLTNTDNPKQSLCPECAKGTK